MARLKSRYIAAVICSLMLGCKGDGEKPTGEAEYIERLSTDRRWIPPAPQRKPLPRYVWEEESPTPFPKITKDYFRCKGSVMNPARIVHKGSGVERLEDCGGSASHSLPVKNGKEFIYPILIDLMNYLQDKTRRKVVITSGHRCLKHHKYARTAEQSLPSKHMMGAEAAFYIQGMEYEPESVVKLLMGYYDGSEFQRYTKPDTDVSTPPWYNREIFIKLYQATEGRDFDNRHPYPYIRVQVRYDAREGKRVLFSWDLAEKSYLY